MRVITTGLLLAALAYLPTSTFAQSDPRATHRSTGRPANLCQELVAFVHQPDTTLKADSPPPQLATAVSAKKEGIDSAKPSETGEAPAQNSGQSGQITAFGPGASGPQGDAQNKTAPVGSTATAAQPTAPNAASPTSSKPTHEQVQQAEAAVDINDIRACRMIAQQMRRKGVVMPAPLLALSALDPQLLEAAGHP